MITTKDKPLDAGKQSEGLLNEVKTPIQNQDTTISLNIKASKVHSSLIKISKNQILISSLIVAEKLKKMCDNVLKKIENLIAVIEVINLNRQITA